MMKITNLLPDYVRIGVISARGILGGQRSPTLEERLSQLLVRRSNPISESEDAFRKACRNMLRIGSYKPTGRGKPASEYLLRAASEGDFPRINTAADINNYISLAYLVPISLWDTDKIEADSWLFRSGKQGEEFVFNPSGQTISLTDLVTGFAVKESVETPVVTPVKDCQLTKTDDETRNIAVAVYYPAAWSHGPELKDILLEFTELLEEVSKEVESRICPHQVLCPPGGLQV